MDIELPTRGTERRDFESLAPVGTLRFRFIGKRLFAFLDFLAFALAAAATAGVLKFTRCGRGSIFLASVGLPLVGVWFIRSPASEIFASLFAGALAVFAIRAALLSIRALRERRKARLLDEEDPFLVESPAVSAVPIAPTASAVPGVPPVRGPASNESPPAAEGKDEPTA